MTIGKNSKSFASGPGNRPRAVSRSAMPGKKLIQYLPDSTYSNPFEQECEYWAVCVPAFSVARAGR